MTRRIVLTLAAVLTFAFGSADFSLAHEGHEHKVMGTVTMAATDHLMLKDTAGREVTITVTPATKVLKDRKPVKIEDVKSGTRVVVTAVTEKKQMVARRVEVGAGPATR